MPVRVQENPSVNNAFKPSLQDFKNAFSLTKTDDFKHSVNKTKGDFYVNASGKLTSANIHGGKGTVTSTVTNRNLRLKLIEAFIDAGASATFIQSLGDRLLSGDGEQGGTETLSRKTVKELLVAFEEDQLALQETVIRKAGDAEMADRPLTLENFRKLARGSQVGANTVVKTHAGQLVIPPLNAGDAARNAELRRGLYAAVQDAQVPPDRASSKAMLLERLSRTLIAQQNLGKPLSCDEIARTLRALDDGLGYVPPKALSDRDIRKLQASGDKKHLSLVCDSYEKEAQTILGFLARDPAERPLGDGEEDALRRFANLRREMAEIGRQALRQRVVDVDHAAGKLRAVFEDFCRANPVTLAHLGKIWAVIQESERTRAQNYYTILKPALETAVVQIANQNMRPRATTVQIAREQNGFVAGCYIDDVLNNAAEGDCLFYAVADACKGLARARKEPSDLKSANEMRRALAAHIKQRLAYLERNPGPRGAFTLHREGDGLNVPHSFGCSYSPSDEENLLSTVHKYNEQGTTIPTVQVAFLAEMINRPIALLMDVPGQGDQPSQMLFYNRNLMTGAKLTGEPIAIYFKGGDNGHYQAVTLNQAGQRKLNALTISDARVQWVGNDDQRRLSLERDVSNSLAWIDGAQRPEAAEPVNAPRVVAQPNVTKLLPPLNGGVIPSEAELEEAFAQVQALNPGRLDNAKLASLRTARATAEAAMRELSGFTEESLAVVLDEKALSGRPAGNAYLAAKAAQQAFVRELQAAMKTVLAHEFEKEMPCVGAAALKLDALLLRAERGVQGLERLRLRLMREFSQGGGYVELSSRIDPSRLAEELPDTGEVDRFIKRNQEKFDQTVEDICKAYEHKRQRPSVSATNRQLLQNVLRHVIAGAFAEKGGEPGPELWEAGSAIDALKTLNNSAKDAELLQPKGLARILSLPPTEVRAYLQACVLIRGPWMGLPSAFAAVADRLSRLPPELFTPANILKLARPDLSVPPGEEAAFAGTEPLASEQVEELSREFNSIAEELSRDNQFNWNSPAGRMAVNQAVLTRHGCSWVNELILLNHPEQFSFEMLSRDAFLPDIEVLSTSYEDAEKNFLADVRRIQPNVTITRPGGLPPYEMPDELRHQNPAGNAPALFFRELDVLCGVDNRLQKRNILCFMSQRSMEPETLLGVARGRAGDPMPMGMNYALRKDPDTGDVIVSKRVNVAPDHDLVSEVRFGTNGSMTLLRAEEQP